MGGILPQEPGEISRGKVVLISVHVKPNSKKGPLVEETDAGLTVYIREPAVEGKANKAIIALLSKHYKVPKTRIAIVKGMLGKHKTVVILENPE